MALLTWITIFPLITAIVAITGPALEDLPLAVRLGITTALTVPLMTWVVMPRVTRLLHRWLYPEQAALSDASLDDRARQAHPEFVTNGPAESWRSGG